jgi:KUP system potassium uptake protein
VSAGHRTRGLVPAAFGTLGIVYGDIGTSPLYALKEAHTHGDLELTRDSAFGTASIVFWSLLLIISVKYLLLVMRADNHGEGGILALTALIAPGAGSATKTTGVLLALGVFFPALRGRAHHAGDLGAQRR